MSHDKKSVHEWRKIAQSKHTREDLSLLPCPLLRTAFATNIIIPFPRTRGRVRLRRDRTLHQVIQDRRAGMAAGPGGGHEHIHCSLKPLDPSLVPEQVAAGGTASSRGAGDGDVAGGASAGGLDRPLAVVAAKYYFNGDSNVVFRYRLYSFHLCPVGWGEWVRACSMRATTVVSGVLFYFLICGSLGVILVQTTERKTCASSSFCASLENIHVQHAMNYPTHLDLFCLFALVWKWKMSSQTRKGQGATW